MCGTENCSRKLRPATVRSGHAATRSAASALRQHLRQAPRRPDGDGGTDHQQILVAGKGRDGFDGRVDVSNHGPGIVIHRRRHRDDERAPRIRRSEAPLKCDPPGGHRRSERLAETLVEARDAACAQAASRAGSVSIPTTSQPRDAKATASGSPIAPHPTSTTCDMSFMAGNTERCVACRPSNPSTIAGDYNCKSGAASPAVVPALISRHPISHRGSTLTASTTSGGEAKASA